MAKLTESQQRDFANQVADILDQHREALGAAGFDPEARITGLRAKNVTASEKEAAQVAAREAQKRATQESGEATDAAYTDASAAVELVAGLLGKDHELVAVMRKIREGMQNTAARGARTPDAAASSEGGSS